MRIQNIQFDLTSVAEELERRNVNPEFVKMVKLAPSVASAHQDLEQCREALALLDKMTKDGDIKRTLNDSEFRTIAGPFANIAKYP